MLSRFRSTMLALALALIAIPARAEPSAADLESARALFREANGLRDAGQHEAALEKYRAANALGRTPITGYELGRAYLNVGRLLEARDALLAVGRLPVKPGESENAAAARRASEELARDLADRVPSVTFEITGVPPGSAVVVMVDGAVVPSEAHALARRLNPGNHTVEVSVDGTSEKPVSFALQERDAKRITIQVSRGAPEGPPAAAPVLAPATPGAPSPTPLAPPPRDPNAQQSAVPMRQEQTESERLQSRRSTYLGLGYAAAGLGVVGLVVGAVAAGSVMSKKSTLDEECVEGQCPESSAATLDSAETSATLAGIATLSGVAFSGVGVVLLIQGYGIDPSAGQESGRSIHVAVGHAF
jgi:hypothetical protein